MQWTMDNGYDGTGLDEDWKWSHNKSKLTDGVGTDSSLFTQLNEYTLARPICRIRSPTFVNFLFTKAITIQNPISIRNSTKKFILNRIWLRCSVLHLFIRSFIFISINSISQEIFVELLSEISRKELKMHLRRVSTCRRLWLHKGIRLCYKITPRQYCVL